MASYNGEIVDKITPAITKQVPQASGTKVDSMDSKPGRLNSSSTTTTSNVSQEQTSSKAQSSSSSTSSSSSSSSSSTSPSQQTNMQQQQQQPQQIRKKKVSDFKFGKIIGEGSYSEVVLATEVSTRKEYAIKILEKRHILKEKKEKYVHREKEVLNKLYTNPFFVKLYFTFQDSNKLYFGLSYAKKGELLQFINKLGSFDENCTRFYAAEIVSALEYLHSLGIIHRDLKPENILLDENMHIQITDFGTAKILDSNARQARANSFVGTAQYVSPELLTDKSACKSSDLWALGCIIYQLLAGLPPFRASNEYLIFQKIIKLEYDFPDGFPSVPRDLVKKLLILEPTKRLGCDDLGSYPCLKSHAFFETMDWQNLHTQTPPALKPYLKSPTGEELRSDYSVPEDYDPAIGENALAELFGVGNIELQEKEGVASPQQVEEKKQRLSVLFPKTDEERRHRLEKQSRENKWHRFVEEHLILKMGLVDKRKGLFARRRQLLLTEGPHLYYVDPENMVLKGEIPWSKELRVETKNFKTFFVHTPNRTYYLMDPENYALEWCKAIEEVRIATYLNKP
ncbi:3-phosphoinositide-dependent protein kinase 1-like [Glandiceps talaboti]